MAHNFFFRRLRGADSGQTLVLAVLMMPVLIGVVGMAVDTGYSFDHRSQMQGAADSASLAGVRAVRDNPVISPVDLAAVVNLDATQNGFAHGSNNVTIAVCRPGTGVSCPTIYTYTLANDAVKVIISQPRPTFFSGILGLTSITVGVTAVSSGGPFAVANANIVVLDPTCQQDAFLASGGSTVSVAGRIYVNSCDARGTAVQGGTPVFAGDGIYIGCTEADPYNGRAATCGGYIESGAGSSFTPTPTLGNPQVPDPLAHLPVPNPSITRLVTVNPNISSGTHTLLPGTYTDGLSVTGGNVTFAPGIYIINGKTLDFMGGATITGTDVMFYTTNDAQLNIQNPTTTVTMSAPNTGPYRGVWYFQDRGNSKDALITGGATIDIDGAFYVSNPTSELQFAGSSLAGAAANYTVFVAWRFKITGGSVFKANFPTEGSPLKDSIALSE